MTKHYKQLSPIFLLVEATLIFKQISSFQIQYFNVFSLIHLNILILGTLIYEYVVSY